MSRSFLFIMQFGTVDERTDVIEQDSKVTSSTELGKNTV